MTEAKHTKVLPDIAPIPVLCDCWHCEEFRDKQNRASTPVSFGKQPFIPQERYSSSGWDTEAINVNDYPSRY